MSQSLPLWRTSEFVRTSDLVLPFCSFFHCLLSPLGFVVVEWMCSCMCMCVYVVFRLMGVCVCVFFPLVAQ